MCPVIFLLVGASSSSFSFQAPQCQMQLRQLAENRHGNREIECSEGQFELHHTAIWRFVADIHAIIGFDTADSSLPVDHL